MPKKKTNWQPQKLQAAAARNKYGGVPGSNSGLQSDDAGIFVTCDRGREGKSVVELVDLLEKAAIDLGYISEEQEPQKSDAEDEFEDIEASIAAEIKGLKPGKKEVGQSNKSYFRAVRLEIPCVSFIKVLPPLDPVKLVYHICKSALNNDHTEIRRSRYVKRLTPVSCVKKTLSGGLEQICDAVLKEQFRKPGGRAWKYAIRPSVRNNNQLNRDIVIKTIADYIAGVPIPRLLSESKESLKTSSPETENQDVISTQTPTSSTSNSVSKRNPNPESESPPIPQHTVSLKNYDLLILVEVYRNTISLSTVNSDYEDLRRFNLAEIWDLRFGREASGNEDGDGKKRV
ncbi:putative thump domain protein [Phaeomoniella chlamydospora]|uniref:Putative thump domain protein n=1 Tax=Phaeomoniella chlamydospora TaxID=158046 RepID=A0A0G2G3L9_PHACM|nr:putative thump domain protein [Phaeomoniella chlamydospora]